MKKFLSIMLALAMVMSLSVTAFAADMDLSEGNGSEQVVVKGEYVKGDNVYAVQLEWGSLEFTYTEAGLTYFDTNSNIWQTSGEGTWATTTPGTSDIITCTNLSSQAMGFYLTFTGDSGKGVSATFTGAGIDTMGNFSLPAAVNGSAAPSMTATVVPSYDGTGTFNTQTTMSQMGYITVTVAPDTALG